jgi:hypothetical protein
MEMRGRRFRGAALALAAGLASATLQGAPSKGKFVPPAGQVLLIVGQDVENVRSYLKAVGVTPGGLAAYTSVDAEGLTEPADNGGGVQHAAQLLESHPNAALQLALYMVDSCEKVINGDLDAQLDRIGFFISAARRPVYLRIGYEFDLPENGYRPDEYGRAFRYIVDRFQRNGVENVAYVWHSYAGSLNRPFEDWYPGDGYVDWFAVSYFDQPKQAAEAFADLAKKHGKPLMIAEAAPWKMPTNVDGRAWKNWFVPMLDYVRRHDVRAITYINCDWDQIPLFESMGWGDTRVQSNAGVLAEWKRETAKDTYLKAGPGLFRKLGYTRSN